ncbi:hypothetical protein [Nannocystis pusilla]|uniref:tetratricopeptide repeat protein n=1 Tax=Nannocystis pusilla TaxID=889268 RepID=UPI003B82AAC7
MTKGTTSLLLLACFAAAAGVAACKRPNAGYALSPWDATAMSSCDQHGPLARTCSECNGGDLKACLTVAQDYEARHDLSRGYRDLNTATSFYGRACELNYIPACVLLGNHYSVVRPEPPARQDAIKVRDASCAEATAACSKKDALACRIEGMCLSDEWLARKNPPDYPKAIAALNSACELGDAIGCARLGWLHAATSKDESSLTQAFAAYQKACDRELAEGCVGAAAYLQHGIGTPPTPTRPARSPASGAPAARSRPATPRPATTPRCGPSWPTTPPPRPGPRPTPSASTRSTSRSRGRRASAAPASASSPPAPSTRSPPSTRSATPPSTRSCATPSRRGNSRATRAPRSASLTSTTSCSRCARGSSAATTSSPTSGSPPAAA